MTAERSPLNPRNSSAPPGSGSRARAGAGRVILATADAALKASLVGLLEAVATDLVSVGTGPELEAALGDDVSVVVADAQLPQVSALQVLTRLRSRGDQTPFVVVTSRQGMNLRIMVSDAEGAVLSSRMVDAGNLQALVRRFLA